MAGISNKYIQLRKLILILQTYPDQMVNISDSDELDQHTVLELSFRNELVPYKDLMEKIKLLEEPQRIE